MKANLLITAVCLGLLTSCADKVTVQDRVSEGVSQGVYATDDSLKIGRVDLAYKYSSQTTRLVPPPKERIKVRAIYAD